MTSPKRYFALAVAALVAACGDQGNNPVAPSLAVLPPPAQQAVARPSLRLSSHGLYYCFHPGAIRNCAIVRHRLRITSSGRPLKWTTTKSQPWIVVSPESGTTPSTVTVSVRGFISPVFFASGTVTVSAAGAVNSPQRVQVVVNYTGRP